MSGLLATYEWAQLPWRKLEVAVFKLQKRISRASQAEDVRRVHKFQRLLLKSRAAKWLAVRRVTQNNQGKHTAGVDGIKSLKPAQRLAVAENLEALPTGKPARRIWIPKPGKNEQRPLSIPTIRDRAMQAVYLLALDPIAETKADPNSYGFRTHRAPADAIEQCFIALAKQASPHWVLEGGIRACFDEISHEWLLAHIPMDKGMLGKWLNAGFMDKHLLHPTEAGTPQGAICSPVMANMTLDGLEARLRAAFPHYVWNGHHLVCPKVNLCRFADDFVITGAAKELLEHEVKPLVEAFLRERGLELSPEKTRITPINEGFDFLGQQIRKYQGKLLIKSSKKSVNALLRKVRTVIRNNKSASAGTLICQLNPIIRGWAMYHRHGVSSVVFQSVDHAIFQALWRWAKRRHPNKGVRWVKARYFHTIDNRNWIFTGEVRDSKEQPRTVHLFTAHSLRITRHVKIDSKVNPYDPRWELYLEQRLTRAMTGPH